MLKGVAGEFDVGAQIELLRNARAISADGLFALGEVGGDCLEGFAGSHKSQHLQFTIGECLVGSGRRLTSDGSSERFGEERSDIAATLKGFADGSQQFAGGALLAK